MIMDPKAAPFRASPPRQKVAAGVYDLVHDIYGRTILRTVTVEVIAGEITGLVGDAGAGKSLLLEIMAGLTRPLLGDVVVAGEAVNFDAGPPGGVGLMPQNPALDERLRVWQWLEYRAAGHHLPRQIAWSREPLTRLGIEALNDIEILDLSPGQRRLADFATLLALAPAVYLLDAPFAGLGDNEAGRLARCVRQEAGGGAGVLIAAAAAAGLRGLATRTLRLEAGLIVEA